MRPLIASIQKHGKLASPVSIYGWVQSVRKMKNVAFADISDGSSVRPLNVVFENPILARALTTGACVHINGELVASPGRQSIEVKANMVDVVGPSGSSYPLQKKYHSREFLRQLPHLRWKTRQAAQILRFRSYALQNFQNFFAQNDVVQVNSPIITASDCEGAGEVFGLENSQKFFGKHAYLSVSSQLHLEVFAASLTRVWNFAPAFRAEASDTNRHLAEFWMVEAEIGFVNGLSELIEFCEQMTKSVLPRSAMAEELLESKRSDEDKHRLQARWDVVRQPWVRMSYQQAIDLLNGVPQLPKLEWGDSLPSEHEKYLASQIVRGVVVITDYPEAQKPFYMAESATSTPNKPTVACFDVLFPEIGEVVGGSMREDNYEHLLNRLNAKKISAEGLEWYTDLRKYGSFPHGGYGLGFERLVMYLCGLDNVRDATGFVRGASQLPC